MTAQTEKFKTTQREDTAKQPDDGSRRRFLKASSMLGLAAAFSPGTIGAAFADSKSKTAQTEDIIMAQTSAAAQATGNAAIRPFQVNFPDADLADLRRRITP